MASTESDDDSYDSNLRGKHDFVPVTSNFCRFRNDNSDKIDYRYPKNVVCKLANRQLYGRVARNPKEKTERLFSDIHHRCRFRLDEIVPNDNSFHHIYMGFTLCSQYFISYTEIFVEELDPTNHVFPITEYRLYIWRFIPGERLKYVSHHRIFKLHKMAEGLTDVKFMQFPNDPYKLVCYGLGGLANPIMAYISILTLPAPSNCRHCKSPNDTYEEKPFNRGWCTRHGFILHYMFSMAQPTPHFQPNISLAFPDYLVVNTGHHIHILNISSFEPPRTSYQLSRLTKDVAKLQSANFTDTCSDISSCTSDNFGIDAILDELGDYDFESNDCNKPFHELNISCEPLNVTGKSYNTLIHNCVKRNPQTSQTTEQSKIDKKTAEKAYEFIEENEKYEKLSSFRKKRLADKKYEFSEDNTENIVPFNSIRKERRFLYRSQNRCIDLNAALFLSPRSPGIRSPMQSPSPRNYHVVSPKEARRFNVYSPGLEECCNVDDSKLVLRQIPFGDKVYGHAGLLVVDTRKEEHPRWIKKLVRRFSSVDFENSSLISGQSRDDYNIPIEIPLLVQTLNDQHLNVVPDYNMDEIAETQLIVTQRTFDCEQFVVRRAQMLCAESHMNYCHCEDYDVKLMQVCPLNGDIICQAVITIGAVGKRDTSQIPKFYLANCIFTWNIMTDKFELIETPQQFRLQPVSVCDVPCLNPPNIHSKDVLVMDLRHFDASKLRLRDYNELYEIYLGEDEGFCGSDEIHFDGYYISDDSLSDSD